MFGSCRSCSSHGWQSQSTDEDGIRKKSVLRLCHPCEAHFPGSSGCKVLRLLRKIAALGLSVPLMLVLDNARYQRCELVQSLARELQIELLFLPSYSPNLNLIERLWKFTKKKALHCRHHTNYADFHAAIEQCLDQLTTEHKPVLDGGLLGLWIRVSGDVRNERVHCRNRHGPAVAQETETASLAR